MRTIKHPSGQLRDRVPEAASAVLQRKCACGKSSGAAGKCGSCKHKELTGGQAKLLVSRPGDRWEQEADRIADQVARGQAVRQPFTPVSGGRLQRSGEETGGSTPLSLGGGSPLEAGVRSEMEQKFGYDFGSVRVHSDGEAAAGAAALHARAFTLGSRVVFSQGAYAPHASEGKRLLAHELTHVIQQQAGASMIQRDPEDQKEPDKLDIAIDEGLPAAVALAQEAIRIIDKGYLNQLTQEKQAWSANFGSPDEKQIKVIKQRYQHVIATQGAKKISLKANCTSADHDRLCAQGEIPGDRIYICEGFAESERCSPGLTMLHEMIHNAGAAGDIDRDGTGTYPPANAENNAYSYEYFIQDAKQRYGAASVLEKPEAELPLFED